MSAKYSILRKILDDIRLAAPTRLSFYKPSPKSHDQLTAARSRALLHLYLMVECGCKEEDFNAREDLICEGTHDGGLDAYFIDHQKRRVLLIQSKYRAKASNFDQLSITADELVKTDFDKITQGARADSKGNRFNQKVMAFQKRLAKIPNIALYKFIVVLLANQNHYSPTQIKRIVGRHSYELYTAEDVYQRLVFPVCQGRYFNPSEISINFPLARKEAPRLNQSITTSAGSCDITVIYVPAIAMGKELLKYKNAILEYNPRNYLDLKESPKTVNAQIAASIKDLPTNDFAILNNGITILADKTSVTDHSGRRNLGVLTLVNPQIINGGQTAYTLSQIYAEHPDPKQAFKGKEVLLKIVTLQAKGRKRANFIGMISNATNQQNPVDEADRRSSHPVLTELQARIFSEYGFFFERKRGEFFNGSRKGYLAGQHIIKRADFIRACYGYSGEVSNARRSSAALFDETELDRLLPNADKCRELFLAYLILLELTKKGKLYKRGDKALATKGNAFTYGRYAVVAACFHRAPQIKKGIGPADMEKIARNLVEQALDRWPAFEKYAREKLPQNSKYFGQSKENFDNYYKGKTVNADIRSYLWR